jgi:hypothetical protein
VTHEGRIKGADPQGGESAGPMREGSIWVGLIPAPEVPEKIAGELASELPGLLGRHVDDRVSWDVPVVVDPLTGTDREAPEILDVCRERRSEEGWDLAVCLTDLPIYRGGRLVVADASTSRRVAGVSVPALGATRLRPRAREALVRLVAELHARVPDLRGDSPNRDGEERGAKTGGGLGGPFRRIEPPDEDMKSTNVEARFAAPGALGHLRLLAGMVLANRPWKLFPSFKGALAAAFATAAYVLVNPALWTLADSVGWARLLVQMVAAIAAMVVWIIVAHHLWEVPNDREARHWATLYNGVTVLTITVAMLLAYAVLFVLVFLAAWVFVPGDYFQSTLRHPVGFGEYVTLAWMASSLATVAGALGAGLGHEETVKEASYGYRQRHRQKEDANDTEDDSAKQ